MLLPDDERVYAFTRRLGDVELLVLGNFSGDDRRRRAEAAGVGGARAACSATTRRDAEEHGALRPWEARVYRREPTDAVQNVHAMRPEVARGLRARARRVCAATTRSRVRFERFFTELRDPLFALYGADPRFPAQWDALLDAIARRPRPRAPASCARSTTSARSRPTGSSASRRSATSPTPTASPARCAGVRERLAYLRELGVTYLHLMPLLRARPAPNDGGYAVVDYGAVEPALGHDGRPARARRRPARARAWRCASTSCSTTPRASTRGRSAALAGDAAYRDFYRTFPDRTEPDAYERTLPEVFPDIAPGSFTWVDGARALGVDDVQRLPVGPRLREPRRVRRDGRGRCSASPTAGVDVLRLDAVAVPVEARWAPTARTSPRSTSCCRRSGRSMRIAAPGGRVQGRGDRRAARPRRLPRRRAPRGQGVRPRLPQPADGAAVERARARGRVALMTQHAAGDAAASPPARAG